MVACSPTPDPDGADDKLASAAPAGLRERYASVVEEAALAEASSTGVERLREAARLARSLYGETQDGAYLQRAERHLRHASRRRRLPGACEAALELAELLARHGPDAESAYLEAYRTAARFGRDGQHTACVQRARWMLGVLDAYRPTAAQLAPIDADPDADDPSVSARPRAQTDPGGAFDRKVTLAKAEVFAATDDIDEAATARVVLRFDGPPRFRRGELAATADASRRAFIEFENVVLRRSAGITREVNAGGLSRIYASRGEGGAARLLFELEGEARYRLFSMTDPDRLVIDVERQRGPDVVRRERGPLVVLDPGHGGEDHGAVGPEGRTEAALALDIARRVRAWIGRVAPEVRVRMTRDSDVLLSLEERAAMANALGASLFLSVHLNASSEPIDHGGVATFVLDVNNDRNVLRLAARENGTATAAVSELQFLVGSLARAEQARSSRRAARFVHQGTLFGGRRFLPRLHDRGVRSAMFYVLVGAHMPAVLVEASFLTQPDEASQLARAGYRDALAEGIARGAVKYLQSRGYEG